MPIFTVTVDDNKGHTKIVTVNTNGMIANVVPNQATIVAAKPMENVNENMGLKKLFDPNSQKGGKRSAPSFRLKKRRITRKLTKAR